MSPKAQRLIDLYQAMYMLTEPECRTSCLCPQSCCSPEYCMMAIEWAKNYWGETLTPTGHPRLPLMGPAGCIAAPHLRPLCTVHTCDVGNLGQKIHPTPDREWDKRYWKLRNEIDQLEVELQPEDRC